MVSQKLINYCTKHQGTPYSLGHNDCFLFALRWADLMRGERVRDQYQYIGHAGALRTLKRGGAFECWQFLDRHYQRSDDHVGALVAWQGDHLGCCGVSLGGGEYATITVDNGMCVSGDRPDIFWSVING